MRITIKASEFLSKYLAISRIGDLDLPKKDCVLLDVEDEVKLYSSSSRVFAEAVLDSTAVNNGRLLIPKTIIPILKSLKDKKINISDSKDHLIIDDGNNTIKLNLFYNMNSISTRKSIEWNPGGRDLSRLHNILYASGEMIDTLDILWIVDGKVITGNKYRFGVFDTGTDLNINGIESQGLSLLNSNNILQIQEEDNFIYIGNRDFNVSIPKIAKEIRPQLLDLLILDINPSCVVDLQEMKSIAEIAKYLTIDKSSNAISNVVEVTGDRLTIIPLGNQVGKADKLSIGSYTDKNFQVKLNTKYLNEALDNCTSGEISLGIKEIYDITIFYIIDGGDIVHYILPMY